MAMSSEKGKSGPNEINAGPFTRILVLLVSKSQSKCHSFRHRRLVQWIWKPSSDPHTIFGIFIGHRGAQGMAEAHAMQFVDSNTSIPVPKVYCAFVRKDTTYVVQQRMKGDPIGYRWQSRSKESKQRLMEQLSAMLKELHSITPPPGTAISNIDGGAFYNLFLPSKNYWGPFSTIHGFHEALTDGFGLDHDLSTFSSKRTDLAALLKFYQHADHRLVFAHGDLNCHNIMVRDDKVTGIIDWECAGWLPSYWDYTSAKQTSPWDTFWKTEVDDYLTPFPEELKMDEIRLKYFGDIPSGLIEYD